MRFDPAIGGEIRKARPAVIVSANLANRALNRVVVVPLTSATGRVFASEALVVLGGRHSKAMADQIRTVAKERLSTRVATVTNPEMRDIEQAIRVHLDLG